MPEIKHRIGFLTGDYLNFGGVETHLLSIFRLLDQTHFESFLIAPSSSNFVCQIEALGVSYVGWKQKTVVALEKVRFLTTVLQEQRISLLHIHSPGISIEGRIAAWLVGIPVIVTVHLQPINYFANSTALEKIKLTIYSIIDYLLNHFMTEKVIYVSQKAYLWAIEQRYAPFEKSIPIPNGICLPLNNFSTKNMRQILGTPKDAVVVCFLGRLEAQKGVNVLLQALFIADRSVLDRLEIWIIGAGSKQTELETLSNELGLQKQVRFLGYQNSPSDFLKNADIFVLPSYYEALSFALLEAMAFSLPCLVTNTGENELLVTHGVTGFVFPIGNFESLSSFLSALTLDSDLRKSMGDSAYKKVFDYSENTMIAQLQSIYCNILV